MRRLLEALSDEAESPASAALISAAARFLKDCDRVSTAPDVALRRLAPPDAAPSLASPERHAAPAPLFDADRDPDPADDPDAAREDAEIDDSPLP